MRLPLILQTEATECALACLAMISGYYGHQIDLNTLRRRYPVSLRGTTLRSLMEIGAQLDLLGRPVRFEMEDLASLRLPAILHWDLRHFVVLKQVTHKGITIHNPATGVQWLSRAEASRHITGVGLELTPTEGFVHKDERTSLPFSVFWVRNLGVGHALIQILALSVILELLVVVAPLYLQLVTDQVIAMGDADLLVVLAVGFGLVAVLQVGITTLRSMILLIVQNALHYRIGARLFHHLTRLPLVYFEKRHIGDVLSRFNSVEPIRNLIAQGMVAAVVDGVMAVVTLCMVFIYSVMLGVIVVSAFLLYTAIRLAMFRVLWQRSDATIRRKAEQDSTFIETLRAVQSLKLFNRESEQESHWLNRYTAFINASIRLGRLQITYKTINDAVFAAENIITIYLAARMALAGSLTVGMIFAFIAYKHNFTEKASLLVEKLIEYKILGLHLERLADIALTPLERGHDRPLDYARRIDGKIELRDVSFHYAETEPFILQKVNLTVDVGQSITLMGPSGGGKTTLIKIMLGLLEPTSGEVLIDDIPLPTIGVRVYRESVAAVMQEDHLLSGSIADNICFFDAAFDHDRMIQCAKLACIHDEIMRMVMAYNTLIGDMGSTLSGGQKQRLLLARALYRQPRILFMDEGTAHLDVEMARAISENLCRLPITRVSVAHRPDVVGSADSILVLTDNRFIPLQTTRAA
jgi:ATP-binding cassette subfamily B protein RaxB